MTHRHLVRLVDFRPLFNIFLATFALGSGLAAAILGASGAELSQSAPLRVAVYDVPPYGYVDPNGLISGVSVNLWRRVAQQMKRHFDLIPVAEMETILSGLEQGRFDAAIGAITIT